jgi:transposase
MCRIVENQNNIPKLHIISPSHTPNTMTRSPLGDKTNVSSTPFWTPERTVEYSRWWKPVGDVVPNRETAAHQWPTHVTYHYGHQPSASTSVHPISNAPDPPSEPYPRAKKQKITRDKGMFTSKRVTPDDHLIVCRKVRAFPTSEQRKILQLWFDGARQSYNWALGVFLKQLRKGHAQKTSRIALKRRFVTCKESCMPKGKRWIRQVPYTIREGATYELSKAISDRFGDAKRMGTPFRSPKFRSKLDNVKSINIDTQNFCKKVGQRWRFYVTLFPDTLRVRKRDQRRVLDAMPDGPIRSVRLSMTRTGKVYLHIPIHKRITDISKSSKGQLVSLDPGSNPFMTYYSPTRYIVGSFGTLPDVERFRRMQKTIDKINSVTDKHNGNAPWLTDKSRKRIRMKGLRIREKAKNLARDAVDKVTNFLTANFQYVHASPFEVSRMCLKVDDTAAHAAPGRRLIRKQTVRDLHGWLHYSFKETLKHKATLIRGLVVEFNSEAHTTKCCDSCGSLNEVGSKKLFVCSTCNHTLHRDVHGARNHALRNCVGRYTLT